MDLCFGVRKLLGFLATAHLKNKVLQKFRLILIVETEQEHHSLRLLTSASHVSQDENGSKYSK